MSAIPSKPLDIHKAITRIEEHYKTTLSLPKDPLALRAIQSIFTQMNPSTLGALSEKENETLRRLYQDISKIPCSQHPSWVQELQKYPNLQAQRLPSSKVQIRHPLETNSAFLNALESDPLIRNWRKAPDNSAEHQAYIRITEYATPITNPNLPPLDLSNLGLIELPACLFTDPIFDDANIAGNKCARFPQELTIGSIHNIRPYEQMIKQIKINNFSVNRVLTNPDFVAHSLSFLNTKDSAATKATSKSFQEGSVLSSRERLQNIKENLSIYNHLSPELQQELDKVNIFRSEEGHLSPEKCHALDGKIAVFLQNESLVKVFPKIVEQLPQEIRQKGTALINNSDLPSQEKASAILAFLEKHKTSLNHIKSLNFERSNLPAIPSGLSFFKGLTDLELNNNQIVDISPLANLTALSTLNLDFNKIVDISHLRNLTALSTLNLDFNKIVDISHLRNLTALTQLFLSGNRITDFSHLRNLTALSTLNLAHNQITDISPLANLTALIDLSLINNQIIDISPLKKLTALIKLYLIDNQITDISPLSNLTALTTLYLAYNQITDISPLEKLTALGELALINNQIPEKAQATLRQHLPNASIYI